MRIKFDKIEYKANLVSKKGTTYAGYVVTGMKEGFGGDPDTPWEKVFFDNTAATIIEKGVARPNMSVVGFFTHAVKPGDRVEIKNVRNGTGWKIDYIQKLGEIPTYTPLSEEDAAKILAEQNAPTRTAPVPTYTPVDQLPWATN